MERGLARAHRDAHVSHLRALREMQGRTLRATARAAGISPGYLSVIENGKAAPSVRVLGRLARVLGLRERELARLLAPFLR